MENIIEKLENLAYKDLAGVHLCAHSVESALKYIQNRWAGTAYKRQRAQRLHRLCRKAVKEADSPHGLKALTVKGSLLCGLSLGVYRGPEYHIITEVKL